MALAKTKKAPAKKTAAAAKGKAKKAAPKTAAKPKKPAELFEDHTFARFTGYRNDVDKSEVVFEEGEVVYIIGRDEDDETGVMYTAIKASDIAEYEANGTDNVTGGEVGPSEISKITGRALEKINEEFTPIAVYGKLEELLADNEDPIEVAISLNHEIQETSYWLGGALAMVLQSGGYLVENGGEYEGENAWMEFCENEFGFKANKGHDLARIYRTFSVIPDFDPSKIDTIGWSKAAIATRFVTPDNVDEILELAEGTSQRELAATLKEKYVSEDGKTATGASASRGIKRVTINFSLDEDTAEGVQLALQAAIKQKGLEGPERIQMALALEAICAEWASEHVQASTKAKSIQTKINKAQKARAAAAAPAPAKAKAPATRKARTKKAA